MNPYEILNSSSYIVVDLETTMNGGTKKSPSAIYEENHILQAHGVSSDGTTVFSIPKVSSPADLSSLISAIEEADILVAHNAKFELQWLARYGLDLTKVVVWDTMLAEYVIYAGLQVELSLGETAKRWGMRGKEPFVDFLLRKKVKSDNIPAEMLYARCKYDVSVTEKLFLAQRKYINKQSLLPVMYTRCILTPCLADIETNGIFLDREKVLEAYAQAERELAEAQDQLSVICGDVNLRSTPQKATLLYETLGFAPPKVNGREIKTASGKPPTTSEAIMALKPRTKAQKSFKEAYTQWAKANAKITKSLNTYKACVDSDDILYARFLQTQTRTHRLSSQGENYSIQFQNQAREFKPMITARHDGWLMAEIDGAQLEFRVAAYLGQDTAADDAIRTGFDVHRFTASVINRVEMDEVTGAQRQAAKADTFKPLYGGEYGTPEQMAYYSAFKDRYKGVAAAQAAWIDEAVGTKKLRTCTGLIFHYPDVRLVRRGKDVQVAGRTQVCNYSVQSLATADIVPVALVFLWLELKKRGLKSFIINTVHDSAIMEIHPDEVEEVHAIAVDCFTHRVYTYLLEVYNIKFNVPLGTGFKVGSHWSLGEEVTENVEPPWEIKHPNKPTRWSDLHAADSRCS